MERLLLGAVLLGAFALRALDLEQNGWGAEYYSAAARSMAASWHNFVYCAFDPAGFISVDKPPVALWIQAASVKLFGFHPASLIYPQVLEGVACVGLVYAIARPRFGGPAALLAALFLAITPVMVAVNRTNNMDSALVLVLLLAAWALLHAAETAKRVWLVTAMALLGVAFNVKMLAGLIVLPTFAFVYLVGAPVGLKRRVADLALGAAALAVVAASWVLVFDLTPKDARPYAGSSTRNSMLELMVGHNAANRFVRPGAPRDEPPGAAPTATIGERLFVRTPAGPLRLAQGQLAAQVAWLLPFAAMALLLGAWQGAFRRPFSSAGQSLLFWLCWTATYVIVYSALGGIIHFYYLATLAPALAVLAGIGVVGLWTLFRENHRRWYLLPATLIATALWQWHVHASAQGWPYDAIGVRADDWRTGLPAVLAIGTASAAVALTLFRTKTAWMPAMLGVGLAALLAMPMAWALSSVLTPGHGVLPSADLQRLDPAVMRSEDPRVRGTLGQSMDTTRLVAFLESGRAGERFLLATTTTRIAAPIIIATGEPVMAMGGFHGLDKAITPEQLAQRVAAREVRFVMLGDAAPPSRRMGADAALEPLSRWVRDNGRRIEGARWRSETMPRGLALYDMRRESASHFDSRSEGTSAKYTQASKLIPP